MSGAKPEGRSKEELLKSLQSGDRERRQGALKYLAANKDPELYIFLLKESDKFSRLEIARLINPQADKNLTLRVINAMSSDDHTVVPTLAYATDPSVASIEVSRAIMDHPERSGARILARKINEQTSKQLAHEYLYSPDSQVSRQIAQHPSPSPEFCSEMMNHPDAEVRFWGTEGLDPGKDSEEIKRRLGAGNYPDVQKWVAAKVPVNDPLFAAVKDKFPAIADWKRRMERSVEPPIQALS